MKFQRVPMSRSSAEPRSFRQTMLAAAMYEPKRSMSNLRLIGSAVSICLGLTLAYASIFYVPAFIDFKGAMHVVGIDQNKKPLVAKVQSNSSQKWGILSPYVDMFRLPRGYLRSGQKLHVDYIISPGTELELTIRQCVSYPVLEVFRCEETRDQKVTISSPREGAQTFRVSEPGFYYYSGKTINKDGSAETRPYAVAWQRRH